MRSRVDPLSFVWCVWGSCLSSFPNLGIWSCATLDANLHSLSFGASQRIQNLVCAELASIFFLMTMFAFNLKSCFIFLIIFLVQNLFNTVRTVFFLRRPILLSLEYLWSSWSLIRVVKDFDPTAKTLLVAPFLNLSASFYIMGRLVKAHKRKWLSAHKLGWFIYLVV